MKNLMWNQLYIADIRRSGNVLLSCVDSTFESTNSFGFYAPTDKETRYFKDTGGLKEP